jgi:hypothetical protein
MIQNTIARLNALIEDVPARIKNLHSFEVNNKPSPSKWSKKEILGHLCDSAINNIPRVVKAQFEHLPFNVTSYAQDDWVRLSDYQNQSIDNVIKLWTSLNRQFVNIISLIPGEKLSYECNHYSEGKTTLKWLIDDYLAHLEHHLKQILPN